MDEEPAEAAGRMRVWWDDMVDCYVTNFPLTDEDRAASDSGNDEVEEEDGEISEWGDFGHRDYRRSLTPGEAAAHRMRVEASLAPWVSAGQEARTAWFGAGV